ncbi:MAG: hypothetical protein JW941_10485 [Candidatus Coatesbacteria bacterium]|nr:hypothetical protein [Candidatus Coatesbacteria bacterium]
MKKTQLTLIILLLAATISATDYYVDAKSGNDANSGLVSGDAWATLSHAISTLNVDPDLDPIVLLAPGGYTFTQGDYLPIIRRLTILGSGEWATEIEYDNRSHSLVAVLGADVLIQNVVFRPFEGQNGNGAEPIVVHESRLALSNCRFLGQAGMISAAEGILRLDCCDFDVAEDGAGGVGFSVNQARFSDCQFSGGWFCLIAGSSDVTILERCQMNDIATDSFWSGEGVFMAGNVELRDCVFHGWNFRELAGLAFLRGGTLRIVNCLMAASVSTGQYGFLFCAENTSSFSMSNCTLVLNEFREFASPWGRTDFRSTDSVLYYNKGPNPVEELLNDFSYCCLDFNSPGEGNISQEPLFVAGQLGEAYLSQTAAGQAQNSPCVDAGSNPAESLGMDRYTTRTDGVPDTGMVDIGYHYPAFPGAEIELEKREYAPDETMYVYGSAWNYALPTVVDVYVGICRPDGEIWTISPSGWAPAISPWLEDVEMSTGFVFPLQRLFKFDLPASAPAIDTSGDYLFAIALPMAGDPPSGGDIQLTPFHVTDD